MTNMRDPRPSYENPPVVEVALSVQFEPIKALRTPQLGLLWQEFRDRFPVIEEHPPLEPVIERFGGLPRASRGTVQFQMLDTPPVPRCWFLNNEGTELIQSSPTGLSTTGGRRRVRKSTLGTNGCGRPSRQN